MNKAYYELKTDIRNDIKIDNQYLDYEMPIHFHRNYEIHYVLEGVYNPIIGNKQYIVSPNDIVFISSYVSHSAEFNDNVRTICIILPNILVTDFEDMLKSKTLKVHLDDNEYNLQNIFPIINLMCSLKNQLKSPIIVKGYINIIIGNLINHYGMVDNIKDKNTELIIDVIQYINKNYEKDLTLDFLANKYSYSKFYFSKLFNKTIGTTLTQYINQVRVQKFVKIYSHNTEQNITELVFSCGFDSLPTFYRAFNQSYNIKPSEYFNIKEEIYW